jgi:hypothetical protein
MVIHGRSPHHLGRWRRAFAGKVLYVTGEANSRMLVVYVGATAYRDEFSFTKAR